MIDSKMSRKKNTHDNVVTESFYPTLKRKLVQDASYDNPEQALMDILNILNFITTLRKFILLYFYLTSNYLSSQNISNQVLSAYKCLTKAAHQIFAKRFE